MATAINMDSYNFGDLYAAILQRMGKNVENSELNIRLGFLRKVFGIVSAQLILTTVVSAAFMYFDSVRYYMAGTWLGFLLMIVLTVISLGLVTVMDQEKHKYPNNFILLSCFTVCESILLGTFVTYYTADSVIKAFVVTCALTIALTVYALQSRRDFKAWGASLFAVLLDILLLSLLNLFFGGGALQLLVTAVGTILFSLYIIYDVTMIMKKVNPEEYVMASAILYLDIINLFANILQIFGKRND